MDQSRKKERWILYALVILLSMVLASFWLICNMYARYSTQTSGSDSARVARFDVTEVGKNGADLTSQINVEVYPGFTGTYSVDVTNKSEVAIEYVLNVKNKYNNLPLQFKMLDGSGKEITTDSSEISEDYTLSKRADISAGDHATHMYQLEISWPTEITSEDENLQSPDYAGKVDIIEITLKAVQKD